MRKLVLAVWSASMVISVCQGSPLTISFSGTAATEYAGNGFPTIPTGTALSGVVTYDTSEIASLACCGSYGTVLNALDGLTLQIGSYTFSTSGASTQINYYKSQLGSIFYDNLSFFDSSGAGWTTNITGLPGPIFGSVSLLGDDGFVAIQPNLPTPNPSLFDPSLYNLIVGGSSLCATVPGSIDCSAVVDLHITSIALVSAPEANSAGLVLVAAISVFMLLSVRSRSALARAFRSW